MKQILHIFIGGLFASIIIGGGFGYVFAQETENTQLDTVGDFLVRPGKIEKTINPGESEIVYIEVVNRTDSEQVFTFSVEDMQGTDTGETAVVLLGGNTGPYSLQRYVQVPEEQLVIPPGREVRVPITISIPENAAPGGLYGSVLTATTLSPLNSEQENVGISTVLSRIGTLLFVTVSGESIHKGEVRAFDTLPPRTFFSAGPIDLQIVFANTGNVHLNPYGGIRIYNTWGKEIDVIELEPWFVLPDSVRLREVHWESGVRLGRYTLQLDISDGYGDARSTEEIVIWFLPWKILLLAAILIGGIVYLLLHNRKRIRHNRAIQ